jgi:hypothetical protein
MRNSRPNFSRISSRHWTCSEAGHTTITVRTRWRRISSWSTRPASIVLRSPTSSAISRFVRGIRRARDDRLELVVLDHDPRAKRRLERPTVGARDHPHRQERVKALRIIDAVGVDFRHSSQPSAAHEATL